MAERFKVPRGCALVPIQPTEAMLDAIAGVSWRDLSPSKQAAEIAAYRQLLQAAARAVDAAYGVQATLPARMSERPMDPGEPENHYARHEGYVEGWNECLDAVACGPMSGGTTGGGEKT